MIADLVNQVKELKVQVGLQVYAICTLKKESTIPFGLLNMESYFIS